jgi:hypothetical protein
MNQKERLLRPTQLIQRLSTHLMALCLLAVLCAGTASASPFEEVKPGDHLYQRVKALEKWGLLDASDQAVLDRGEAVTRLQLAFYTEKAKTRIAAPVFPTATPALTTPAQKAPEALPALVAPSQPAPQEAVPQAQAVPEAVAPATPVPQPTAVMVPPSVSKEIDDLLKAMKNESAYLRARQPLLDGDIKTQEAELQEIKRVQTNAEGVVRKANKNSGDWSFNTNVNYHFEDFTLTGDQSKATLKTGTGTVALKSMSAQRITKSSQDIYFGMWGSLGKGSLSTGFGGTLPSSNDSSWPVSLYLGRPEFKMALDGRFGTWNFFAMDEGFHGETTMGDFTRGVASDRPKRYDSPFNIKCWSSDKFDKNWDDYIHSLGFVETQSLLGGLGQSTSDRVFDGITVDGSDLPKLGPTKVKFIAGRMLSPTWFEYGLMAQRPWLNNRFTTKAAGYWVQDTNKASDYWVQDTNKYHVAGSAVIDMKNYTGELSVDLKPVPLALSFEGAQSSLWTGVYTPTQQKAVLSDGTTITTQGATPVLIGDAIQFQASSYPFNFYYQAIKPGYSNFQSKVDITGIDFNQYGLGASSIDELVNKYGEVGEADVLQSNRKGWRVNLGWNGRRDEWMKQDLPKFLDYFVLNMDRASREEYVAVQSAEAGSHYVLEPWCFVAPYYPEDEGVWGLELYGGYGGTPKPVRSDIISNISAARTAEDPQGRAWSSSYEWVRYRFQMSSERIPLLDPVTGSDLSHIKTYKFTAISNKWQLNRLYDGAKPLYLALYYGDNVVSGQATDPTQSDISRLFHQRVADVTLMAARLLPYVQVSVHYADEKWDCDYSIPRIKYDTTSKGAGLDYNIPWGSAKLGLRYNHVVFNSEFVPANNYVAEQVWLQGNFRF